MTPLSTEAARISRELALELQTTVRRADNPNVIEVRSRNPKTPNTWYAVTRGVDYSLICSCIASFYPYRGECWHLNEARKVFGMTTESKALVPVVVVPPQALLPTQRDLDVINQAAAMVYAGGVSLPPELNTKEKVAAIMLYGLELGLRPMTAIQNLYIVKGRVAASAQVMAGLCMNKEKDIEFHVEQTDGEVCTIRMVRPSRRVNEAMTITWDMIKRANLAGGQNANYPEDRLRYHCMKRLCRTYAPDLINGLDEGVPVAGVTESEWRVEEADLYNEGDAPLNVDRETGEILDDLAIETDTETDTNPGPDTNASASADPAGRADGAQLEAETNAARQMLYDEAVRIKKSGAMTPTGYGNMIRRLGARYNAGEGGKFSTVALSLEDARAALAEMLEDEAGAKAEARAALASSEAEAEVAETR